MCVYDTAFLTKINQFRYKSVHLTIAYYLPRVLYECIRISDYMNEKSIVPKRRKQRERTKAYLCTVSKFGPNRTQLNRFQKFFKTRFLHIMLFAAEGKRNKILTYPLVQTLYCFRRVIQRPISVTFKNLKSTKNLDGGQRINNEAVTSAGLNRR